MSTPTKWVWSGATGANDGTSETDAWTALSSALAVTAGDVILIRGTQTLTTAGLFSGTGATTNRVTVMGTDESSWTVDGSRAIINANSAANYCFQGGGTQDQFTFKNFEFKNALINGWAFSTSGHGMHVINCISHNNAGDGFSGGGNGSIFEFCRSYSNSSDGWIVNGTGVRMYKCQLDSNTAAGVIASGSYATLIDCLSFDNGDDGFIFSGDGVGIRLTANNNTDGVSRSGTVFGTINELRATDNSGYGLNSASSWIYMGSTYMPNTSEDLVNGTGKTNGTVHDYSDSGIFANQLSGTDSDGGYTDSSSGDYNILNTASLFGVAETLDATNKFYTIAGANANPAQSSGAAGNAGRSYPRGVA